MRRERKNSVAKRSTIAGPSAGASRSGQAIYGAWHPAPRCARETLVEQPEARAVLRVARGAERPQSIAAAAEEQSAASEQVSRNVENIAAAAKQATEGSAQSAQAAVELSTKSDRLLALVGRFNLAKADFRRFQPFSEHAEGLYHSGTA